MQYALVTRLEAMQRCGASPVLLEGLQSVRTCNADFYLATQVEALVSCSAQEAGSDCSTSSSAGSSSGSAGGECNSGDERDSSDGGGRSTGPSRPAAAGEAVAVAVAGQMEACMLAGHDPCAAERAAQKAAKKQVRGRGCVWLRFLG